MIYIGIDPGLKGGIAIFDDRAIITMPTPVTEVKGKKMMDPRGIFDIVTQFDPLRCRAVIEHQHARAKVIRGKDGNMRRTDTPATAFSLGCSFGITQATLTCCGIGYQTVEPGVWQKALGVLSGEPASIAGAKAMFPTVSLIPPRGRVDHSGMAAALLLAEYCRRTNVIDVTPAQSVTTEVIDDEEWV